MLKGGYQIIDIDDLEEGHSITVKGIYDTILNCNKPILVSGFKASHGNISFFAIPTVMEDTIVVSAMFHTGSGIEFRGINISKDDSIVMIES